MARLLLLASQRLRCGGRRGGCCGRGATPAGEVVELASRTLSTSPSILLSTSPCSSSLPGVHTAIDKKAWAEAASAFLRGGGSGPAVRTIRLAGSVAVMFAMYDVQQRPPRESEHASIWQATSVPALVLAPRGERRAVAYGNLAGHGTRRSSLAHVKGVPVKGSTSADRIARRASAAAANNNNSLVTVK